MLTYQNYLKILKNILILKNKTILNFKKFQKYF